MRIWAERIRESGADDVWVYVNNDREGFAIKHALVLRRLLRSLQPAKCGGQAERSPDWPKISLSRIDYRGLLN